MNVRDVALEDLTVHNMTTTVSSLQNWEDGDCPGTVGSSTMSTTTKKKNTASIQKLSRFL